MSDAPSPTFLGFEIVCNNFDTCHAHRSCRDFRSTTPKKPGRNEYARTYRNKKRAEKKSAQELVQDTQSESQTAAA